MLQAAAVEWDQVCAEAVALLGQLLRIDTSNPPGNESRAVSFLMPLLMKEGLDVQSFEAAPGRGSLIASFPGLDADKGALLLSSHLDVVPAEPAHWRYPPFAGEVHDGAIWGRGAVDMKQMTVMEMMAIFLLKRRGLKPKRKIIMAAVADEEAGCRYGSQWLVENHPQLLAAEYALNELGAFTFYLGGKTYYPIGVAEKGVCWFEVRVQGDPGHGSMPNANNAVVKLARAAYKLGKSSLRFHLAPVVKDFISGLAQFQSPPTSWVLQVAMNPLFSNFVLKNIFPDKEQAKNFHFLLHSMATPTGLAAGTKINVIPSEAVLKVDGRILPGQTVADFLADVEKTLGPGYEINVLRAEEATVTDYHDEFFKILKQVLMRHDPAAIPIPFLIPGYTDAQNYAKLGIKTYGFCPTRLSKGESFAKLYHGHDERLSVDSLLFGIKVMWDTLLETCF